LQENGTDGASLTQGFGAIHTGFAALNRHATSFEFAANVWIFPSMAALMDPVAGSDAPGRRTVGRMKRPPRTGKW
jgi:hypothetical protein